LFGGSLGILLRLLVDVSEYVIKNEVSGWLLSKNESLYEFLKLSRLVGSLSDDLNNDVLIRRLRVNIRNADLAVLEVELFDTLLNCLQKLVSTLQVLTLMNSRFVQEKQGRLQPLDQKPYVTVYCRIARTG
jgi:hypothetical protein